MVIEDKKDWQRGLIRVPTALLGVFIFMSAQTFGAIWWASSISTTLKFVNENQIELKALAKKNSENRYTTIDAKTDFKLTYAEINVIREDLRRLNQKVTEFQAKYEATLNGSLR